MTPADMIAMGIEYEDVSASDRARCPSVGPQGQRCAKYAAHTEHMDHDYSAWVPTRECSVHCMPSCSYPKCVQ